MKKHTMKVAALGLAVVTAVSVLPTEGMAVKNIEEKPLAGITLSLDQFCESVLKNQAEEAAAAAVQEQAGGVTQQAAGNQTQQQKEQKETEEKIRLNLNMDKLGIAKVNNYLNVRKKPGEDSKIIGKMTRNNGCNVLSTKNGWSKIESGKVKGYVKSCYLITGKEAQEKALEVATQKAVSLSARIRKRRKISRGQ